MNIVKSTFCRTYQQVFHLALPVLPYRKPGILGNVEELADLLVEKDIRCVMSGDRPDDPFLRADRPSGRTFAGEKDPLPLLIAVPTTAGTGSETTLAAVIVDAKSRHKYPINDFPLIPRYAVLDPEVTRSLPPALTATTGMDALTHAVEAYIGRSTTKETRQDAVNAVRLIFANIRDAYEDGSNMKARKQMLRAAYLAGNAFTRSYVGYVHAVAHSLGGKYNTPHGLAGK